MNDSKSNNKIMIIVTILIVVGLVSICFLIGGKGDSESSSKPTEDVETIMSNLQKESAAVTDEQKGEFGAYIKVSDYLELYNKSEEYSLVWVARPTCSYCELTTPVIQKLIKDYGIYISYLDTDEFADDDMSTFIGTDEKFKEGFGTPMLLLVGNGQVLDMVDGATDQAHYLEFLKMYKFIKE